MIKSWYAVGVSIAVLLVGAVLVISYPGAPGNMYWIPPGAAVATYLIIGRMKMGEIYVATSREYSVHAPKLTASLAAVLDELGSRGYELDVVTVDLEGRPGAAPADDELSGAQLKLRDRRATPTFGDLTVRLNAREDGVLQGFLAATDSGPGFYDELAQYFVLALSQQCGALRFATPGKNGNGVELATELPAQPYGLNLL